MQLDLKKLFDAEEQVLPFSMELDLSGVEQWGDRPFKTPIAIKMPAVPVVNVPLSIRIKQTTAKINGIKNSV